MQLISEISSPEVSARRSKSDPSLTPRQSPRVGTPYPKPPQKSTLPPSKIPRLTSQNSQTLDLNNTSCHRFLKRTDLAPSPNLCQPSTTTLYYPREILYSASPQGSSTDLYKFYQPPTSPPLVQVYRKKSQCKKPPFTINFTKYGQQRQQALLKQQYQQIQPPTAEYKLTSCKDCEILPSRQAPKAEPIYLSSTSILSSKTKLSRNSGAILDSEGYIQGPHTAHNKRIESYGRPLETNRSQIHLHKVDQDRGDYIQNTCIYCKNTNNNNTATGQGLPPLPPKVRNKNDQDLSASTPRIATATLSQGNTVLEPHSSAYLSNYSSLPRPNSRSLPPAPTHNNCKLSSYGQTQNSFNSFRKLTFSSTSLQHQSKVHEAESCTNLLLRKKYSEPQFVSNSRCPLCVESKGQCHLHHRTMCSRYMTDLEWRICHAVNIYVYKNGEEGQTPVLVHIPPSKKKNMRSVMTVIQERVCYPIGYAQYLYKMNGKKVTNPCELEMYNNYVVASNYDRCFKCVCYARRKSPLLVLSKESKHVRELRLKNYQYELYLSKKRSGDEEHQFDSITESGCGYPEGYIPGQIPVVIPIGLNQSGNLRVCGEPCCTTKNYASKKNPKYTLDYMPVVEEQQNPRNSAVGNGSFEYIVGSGSGTISTAPLKDPAEFMPKNSKKVSDESMPSPRYKGLMADEESLFYSSKKKKLNRGVIDTSGESKKVFYEESKTNDNMSSIDSQGLDKALKYNSSSNTENKPAASSVQGDIQTDSSSSAKVVQPDDTTRRFYGTSPYDGIDEARPIRQNIEKLTKIPPTKIGMGKEGKGDEKADNIRKDSPPDHLMRSENVEGAEHPWTKDTDEEDMQFPSMHIIDEAIYPIQSYKTGVSTPTLPRENKDTDGNPLISAPSVSYTVIANQNDEGQRRHRQVHRVPTPVPVQKEPRRIGQPRAAFKELNENSVNARNINKLAESINQYHDSNSSVASMYAFSGASPIYLAGSQTAYTCFGPTVPQPTNGFFVQSTPTNNLAQHPQPQLQQLYPVEILNNLNQRPSYGPLMVDSSNMNCYGRGITNNNYYTDEIDIPYTPPVPYQPSSYPEQASVPNYRQVPSYLNVAPSSPLSHQFTYGGDYQGYSHLNRSMGLVAIQKPSRRNVAIQMGEPSSSSLEIPLPSHHVHTTDSRIPKAGGGSPRSSHLICDQSQPPGFYYSSGPGSGPGPGSGNPNHQEQYHHPDHFLQHSPDIQNNDLSVLPPPTRYRDGSQGHRPCRSLPKQNYNNYVGGSGRDDSFCNENNSEFYDRVQESKHPQYLWKKS